MAGRSARSRSRGRSRPASRGASGPGRRDPGPRPRRARAQHPHRGGAPPLPPSSRRLPRRRQLLARSGTISGRPRRTGTARCSTTTPATPGSSTSGRSRRCSSSTSGGASTRSGTAIPYRVFVYTTRAGAGHAVLPRRDREGHRRVRADDWPRCSPRSPRTRPGTTRSIARCSRRSSSATRTRRSHSASLHPAVRSTCPGITMPGFKDLADVIRRIGHLRARATT